VGISKRGAPSCTTTGASTGASSGAVGSASASASASEPRVATIFLRCTRDAEGQGAETEQQQQEEQEQEQEQEGRWSLIIELTPPTSAGTDESDGHALDHQCDTEAEAEAGLKDDVCAICQMEWEDGEIVRQLPGCGHVFHRECIDEWLLHSSTCCPIDKTDLRQQ
jgi:hypothetical protein